MLTTLALTLTLNASAIGCMPAPPSPGEMTFELVAAPPTTAFHQAVEALAEFSEYRDHAVGYGGIKPPVYEAFERLAEVADDAELESLLGHWSPVVRAYAYQGLLQRGRDPETFRAQLVGAHVRVRVQFGCLAMEKPLSKLVAQLERDYRAGLR